MDGIVGGSPDDFKRFNAFTHRLCRPVAGPIIRRVQLSLDNHLAMIALVDIWASENERKVIHFLEVAAV
jgi:hypothetical protein